LLLISLFCLTSAAYASDYLLPLEGRQQFTVFISARGMELTGVCIIKTDEEGSKGAIVNEFGVHALDFTLSSDRRKVKLLNVMPVMDHWYIKKVVRGDLKYLFLATENPQSKGKRTVTVEDDGTVTLENMKYRLKYSLKPINNTQDDETAE
jgi:hypothetical protein